MYKLVALDIDGTLLNKDRAISKRTQNVVQALSPSVKVVLISSRMPKAMRYLQKDLAIRDQPIIAYNGGLVLANNTELSSIGIDNTSFQHILEYNQDLNLHLSLYHKDEWFAPQVDYWTEREQHNTKSIAGLESNLNVFDRWKIERKDPHKIMCMGDEEKVDVFYKRLEDNLRDSIHVYRSKPTYIEISPKSTDKLKALQRLLQSQYPDIHLKDVIAFGDNYNDIEMLTHVGHGVAVGNAKPELKAVADDITETNVNDGVAIYLEKLFRLV